MQKRSPVPQIQGLKDEMQCIPPSLPCSTYLPPFSNLGCARHDLGDDLISPRAINVANVCSREGQGEGGWG